MSELPLEADAETLEALVALLPLDLVYTRRGDKVWPSTRSLAVERIRHALAKGYLIDRSNSDGPLNEWDGWLVLDYPQEQIGLLIDLTKI